MKIITGKVNTLRTFFQMQGVYLNDPADAGAGFKFPDTPLLEKNVRAALNRAINRDALNEAFFFNLGQKMHAIHVAETHGAFNQRWKDEFDEKYGYDPAAARSLLREAGYDSNNPVETNMFILEMTAVLRRAGRHRVGGPDVVRRGRQGQLADRRPRTASQPGPCP